MNRKNIITEIAIYAIFLLVALFSFTFDTGAQTIVKDASGNYRQISAPKDSTGGKLTGATFTTKDGTIYPVYESKNGKLFVRRVSKSGTTYNYYLKLN